MTTNISNTIVYLASGRAEALMRGNQLTHLTYSVEEILYKFSATKETLQSIDITNSGSEPFCITGVRVLYPSCPHVIITSDLARNCEADTYKSE